MIACLLIPGFELRAALRKQPGLALRPAALSPVAGTEPLLGPVTAAAERLGVRPGMRLGEGLATCPELVLVEQDPAAAEQAWEEILRALEDTGFAVDPAGVGCVYFETRGVRGCTAGSSLRCGARSPPSVLPGIHVRAQRSAGSQLWPQRTSRAPGRSWSSPTSGCGISSRRCRSSSCRWSRAAARSCTSSA